MRQCNSPLFICSTKQTYKWVNVILFNECMAYIYSRIHINKINIIILSEIYGMLKNIRHTYPVCQISVNIWRIKVTVGIVGISW